MTTLEAIRRYLIDNGYEVSLKHIDMYSNEYYFFVITNNRVIASISQCPDSFVAIVRQPAISPIYNIDLNDPNSIQQLEQILQTLVLSNTANPNPQEITQ